MTPETVRWLIGILVTLLVATIPVLVSVINRKNDTIERLKEANLNYRLALLQLGGTAEAVVKIGQAIPLPTDGTGK